MARKADLVSGAYLSAADIATALGVSNDNARLRHAIEESLRRWRHGYALDQYWEESANPCRRRSRYRYLFTAAAPHLVLSVRGLSCGDAPSKRRISLS